MPDPRQDDAQNSRIHVLGEPGRGKLFMTTFIESCVETVTDSAKLVERTSRTRPRAARLLRILRDKRDVLVTTHLHPDPDALASCYAMATLLRARLPEARVTVAVKGKIGGGYNTAFQTETDMRLEPWDDEHLHDYDAVILLDVQPGLSFSPLPEDVPPIAVVDHHRTRGGKMRIPFHDVRTDVGATSSIMFSYLMDMEVDIPSDLAAALLFAIETDLAGAAGQPRDLDNMALSSLTLLADTHRLYRMRHSPLPLSIYTAIRDALVNAMIYDEAMASHIEYIESQETPAVAADFLLRYEHVQWVLVTAISGQNLVMSLRTHSDRITAAELMRKIIGRLGEGGGHRTKGGGSIRLATGSDTEVEQLRRKLLKRMLRALGVPTNTRGQRLVNEK
ncbi:MAG: bifunctional oligoribonuclease/PAP phosphatase NrnA [Tepidisphaerales bacterium]